MSALRRLVATSLILGALLPSSPSHAADVTVSAAASLRDAFTEIAREFERANPQHRVLLNIGASGQLLQQIARGAPVDVFAAADQDTMDRATAQGLVMRETRVNFARNDLVLAVPASTKSLPAKLADLGGAGFERITIGTPESVPAGRYAKRALDAANLWTRLKPKLVNTQNVRQAMDYVARGEADAGFVYLTDAALMPDRIRVAFTVPLDVEVLYPIAVVKGGGMADLGKAFVKFVASDKAQAILARFQFRKP
jgi:molybdate transport system substrate-binding protein